MTKTPEISQVADRMPGEGKPAAGRPATAYVMNMFYTGLGIARSLGERGVPVVGLTSQRGVAGNFTRYAKSVRCPDSRDEPEALRSFLVALGRAGEGGVIFPTRDDDLVFLSRFRADLEPYFRIVAPPDDVLRACLNKWETYLWAERCGVPAPKSWLIESHEDLRRILPDVPYPCVLKPLNSHLWRCGRNWEIVGARKAIPLHSEEELTAEYAAISQADPRAVLQAMVRGGDDRLLIAACFLDRQSRFVAGFNTQKLRQVPEGFGTGCIVATASVPELFPPSERLLQAMGFQGIAEVEYKWDSATEQYMLIEINPRAWDQHRLGASCGVDLVYLAYCEYAGLPRPELRRRPGRWLWIAEDTFFTTLLRLLWRRDPAWRELFRLARGKRVFAIWSARDPLPLAAYLFTRFLPWLLRDSWRYLKTSLRRKSAAARLAVEDTGYEGHLAKRKSIS